MRRRILFIVEGGMVSVRSLREKEERGCGLRKLRM